MSKRFIVDGKNINVVEDNITVVGDEVHHINVLRYKIKDRVYINKYDVEITKLDKFELKGKILGQMEKKGVPKLEITLVQAFLKADKMEYVVQKAVELGVKNVIPVISRNTVVKLDEKDKLKKKQRLEKIAKEAVEQCGRTDEVEISDIMELKKVDFYNYDAVVICHEQSNIPLKQVLNGLGDINKIAIVIGPEGGLDEKEVEFMSSYSNAKDVSLGERILRAETASMNVLSVINFFFDN